MPLQPWLDAGVTVALGSDSPSTPWYTPQVTLFGAVPRVTFSNHRFEPDQDRHACPHRYSPPAALDGGLRDVRNGHRQRRLRRSLRPGGDANGRGGGEHNVQYDPPVAVFTPSATGVAVGESVRFDSTSQYADAYRWDFGDGGQS